jgi:hypothetical protein
MVADYDEDHAGEAGLLKEGLTLEGGVGEGKWLLGGGRGCPAKEKSTEKNY